MRIAIGQVWQETNTLNEHPTTRTDFEAMGVYRGAELLDRMRGVNEPGGFLEALERWPRPVQPVGLARLAAWPGGALDAPTFDWVLTNLLESLTGGSRPDGVLLALHGSMAAENEPDTEGAILEAVRDRLDNDTPIVATLDLHANVTQRMVDAADALVLYHTVPHIDVYETGVRAAAVLQRLLLDDARPITAFIKIPMVIPAELADTQDDATPAGARRRQLELVERQPAVLTAGVATVQPWLDIPELGTAVLVVTDDDATLASQHASTLAADAWATREHYVSSLMPFEEAVAIAHAQATNGGLCVLGDGADATTSGAPGDSSWVLGALLNYDWPRPAIAAAVAPELVEAGAAAGAGQAIDVSLGAKRDSRFGRALSFTARVERLFDARFTLTGHIGRNMPIDMGRSVLLRQDNVWLVATSRTGPHFAPELFDCAGLDPFSAAVLVAKSPAGFRAVYRDRASRIISVRSPGCAPADFWCLPFERIPRPLWPWDRELEWSPTREARA